MPWRDGWENDNHGNINLSNIVGPGNYPLTAPADLNFNSETWTAPRYPIYDPTFLAGNPFARATYFTFDGMVLGSNTRVIIYSQPGFQGSVLFDPHGPYLLEDPSYGMWIGIDMSDWSGFGGIYSQFTPDTRHVSPTSMHNWGRGTSAKVICD